MTQEESETMYMAHTGGGGLETVGWAVVERHGDGYCTVTQGGFGSVAYLALEKLLTPNRKLSSGYVSQLRSIREAIKSGVASVIDNRIINHTA